MPKDEIPWEALAAFGSVTDCQTNTTVRYIDMLKKVNTPKKRDGRQRHSDRVLEGER